MAEINPVDFPLHTLKNGESGIVTRIHLTGRTKRRLIEMGITPGTAVAITKRAPLGDPIEIVVRGYALTLRKEDAELILVKRG